jgi:hypothetical protein
MIKVWSFLVLFLPCSLAAQSLTYEWVQRQGSTEADATYAIATDGTGASYFCGSFSGTVNFGGVTLTSKGASDAFIVRYSAVGVLDWAKQINAPFSARGNAIAVGKNGDLYVTGLTRDTAKLSNSDSLANNLFVAKLDTAGNLLWMLKSKVRQSAIGNGIAVSASGRLVYLAAAVRDTMVIGGMTASAAPVAAIVLGCIGADGSIKWLRQSYGSGLSNNLDAGYCVTSDENDNVYLGGEYADTLNYAGIHLNGPRTGGALISSFDSSGTVRWVRAYANYGAKVAGLCEAHGSLYGTGPNAFAIKFEPNGDVDRTMQNTGTVIGGTSIAADQNDGVFVTGQYAYPLQVGNISLFNAAAKVYLLKFDTALTPKWVMQAQGGVVTSPAIAADSMGRRFLSGTFIDSLRMNNFFFGSRGKTDGFVTLIDERVVSTILPGNTFCPGDTMYVNVHALGQFNPTNYFTVETSDAQGSFSSPLRLKTVTATSSLIVPVYIPLSMPPGTKYRVRTWAASPSVVGADNGYNVTINPLPTAKMAPSGNVDLCQNDTVLLTATGGEHYLWSTGDTTATIAVGQSGSYSVTVIGTNTCDIKLPPAVVTVRLVPPVPAVTRSGDSLLAFGLPGLDYQWYRNGSIIQGATGTSIYLTRNGSYVVTASDRYHCLSTSSEIIVDDLTDAVKVTSSTALNARFDNGYLKFSSSMPLRATIQLCDILGRVVWSDAISIEAGESSIKVANSTLPQGAYYLIVRTPGEAFTFKMINNLQ